MKIKNKETGKIEDIRLPKTFKSKWTKALRSGKYKQGNDYLQDSEGNYCCLGVACRIQHPKLDLTHKLSIGTCFNRVRDINVPKYIKDSYVGNKDNIIPGTLAAMNDSGKWSFKRIAIWIDKNL